MHIDWVSCFVRAGTTQGTHRIGSRAHVRAVNFPQALKFIQNVLNFWLGSLVEFLLNSSRCDFCFGRGIYCRDIAYFPQWQKFWPKLFVYPTVLKFDSKFAAAAVPPVRGQIRQLFGAAKNVNRRRSYVIYQVYTNNTRILLPMAALSFPNS